VNDYPAAITAVDHVEPVPRRIRAFLAGETVLDTIRALYVWEWPYGRLSGPDSGDLFARIGRHRRGSHESFEARSPAAVSVVVHDSAGGDA
jgi:hypothetical protein